MFNSEIYFTPLLLGVPEYLFSNIYYRLPYGLYIETNIIIPNKFPCHIQIKNTIINILIRKIFIRIFINKF